MPADGRTRSLDSTLARLREDALSAFRSGVAAVAPREITARHVGSVLEELGVAGEPTSRLWVLGAGKAAAAMAQGVEDAVVEVFGPDPNVPIRGAVVCPRGSRTDLRWVEMLESSHPLPGPAGEASGRRLLSLASEVGGSDVVVALLSGGASALLSTPAPGLCEKDLEMVTRQLLDSGASIVEVNAVRKHLSAVSGGMLGLQLGGARTVCLLVSDVVGDDPAVIGGGPFHGDGSTFQDCLDIVRSRGLLESLPAAVGRRLETGAAGLVAETPSPSDPLLTQIEHRIIASALDACRAAERRCIEGGYHSLLLSHTVEGEAREVGVVHAGLAWGALQAGVPLPTPCALISGGETTVIVRGDGVGGRNQESCLAAVPRLAGLPAAFLSAGTDGIDGPTRAAGGLVDGLSATRAREGGIDVRAALAGNDSHTALKAMGDLVVTGVTGTNVADLRVVLVAG